MLQTISGWLKAIPVFATLALALALVPACAQNANGIVKGTIADASGKVLVGASVTLEDAAGSPVQRALTDKEGSYSFANVAFGRYNLAVSATGFRTQERVVSISGGEQKIDLKLALASVAEEVVVEAEDNSSLAVQSAPVRALLDAASSRTEISSNYIAQYTSPVTDFADIIQAAPGTVSYTTNGIGNGQAKIFFRGFVDDDYSMTWDGVPFNDSNDPSHHSWAYVPAAAIGYVDFDRSPGTASDIGTSNFGGTIHFFSPRLSDEAHIRIQETHGTWNTNQILGDINSGAFLNGKAHFWLNADYQNSDGYQTNSPKQNVAATAKFDYKFSDRTQFTVIGSNIILDAFNNNDPTRRQLFHYGDNYLYDATQTNSAYASTSKYYYDPQFWRFSVYHVPSFFDIITFNHDFGKGWKLDTKTYTYGYSNHQHYQNKTDQDLTVDAANGMPSVVNEVVGGDDQPTTSPAYSKTPTGIDKLNQYARGGEIAALSYATKWGVFRTGNWFEETNTLRYQIYTDPLTWVDSSFISNIKFHEHFYTYAVQPYAEFQFVSIPRWTITAGVKDAFFRMNLTQWADGKTVGALGCAAGTTPATCTNTVQHAQNYNSILPSFEANYRINNNWSAYGQYGRGSIAPFSAVFDAAGAQVAVTPPPTIADTYQGGTVVKLNRFTFDADAYHIHFMNTYSSYTPSSGPDTGFTYYYANPDSTTNGFEAEGNVVVAPGLSFNANGTFGIAKFEAAAAQAAVYDSTGTSIITPATPATPEAWVATTPHDTESLGMTYRQKGLDFGIFGKRIGSRWADIGNYHQTVPEDPFWMSNVFLNYSVHGNSIFNGSKIKLSINNLFDDHSIVLIGAANDGTYNPATGQPGTPVTATLQTYSPSWNDTLEKQAGRAVMISFQLGLTRREK
jgi:iron complex outermembrane receptor protein